MKRVALLSAYREGVQKELKELIEGAGGGQSGQTTADERAALKLPVEYAANSGGKLWRSSLMCGLQELLQCPPGPHLRVAAAVELVHLGTLMADDVEDASPIRRGLPSTHVVFGVPLTINASSWAYFAAMETILSLPFRTPSIGLALHASLVRHLVILHSGQGVDILWSSRGLAHRVPTEHEYFAMSGAKTGGLSNLAADFAVILSEKLQYRTVLASFASSIGVSFQIFDDVLDLASTDFQAGKGGQAQDIAEGKISLPLIYALSHSPHAGRLREIISMRESVDARSVQEAVEIIRDSGALTYSRAKGESILLDAWHNVQAAFPDSKARSNLGEFVNFLLERKT